MSAELLTSRPAESESTLVLTLSNPGARNALHPDMYAAGIEALDSAERDPSIRAIVLTGADNFFCAGGNLNRLLENRAKDPSVQAQSIDMLGEWIARAACFVEAGDRRGRRRGRRRGLFAGARVRPARRRRRREVRDVVCARRSHARWRRLVVPRAGAAAPARHRSAAGRQADRRRAPARTRRREPARRSRGAARDSAIAWADELGKISPNAIARIKTLIAAAGAQPLADHLVAERDNFVASLHHGDALEGITAFLEKRAPVYK